MKNQFLSSKKSVLRIVLAVFVCLWGMNGLLAQTAVLQHEGERTVFYGSDSFIAAYNAAVDEDVITLSEGCFNCSYISKSINIHGAGAYEDAEDGRFATIFVSNNQTIIGNNSSPIIEGVYFRNTTTLETLANARFVKCRFSSIIKGSGGNANGVHFINCIILNISLGWNLGYNGQNWIENMNVVNSVIWGVIGTFAGQNHVATNSIIRTTDHAVQNITAYNSILIINDDRRPSNTCTFYNCIGVGSSVFENSLNSTVIEYDNITDVFPDFMGEDIFNEPFFLDEGIATGFPGTDGTEVGIHGGFYPYSNRPGYMKVRHCTVGDRTTDDGHLSVDIEVVTEE